MIRHQHNAAFTLIEVLLVVVIMATLAGTVLSRFLDVADDAKTSSLNHNLHVMEAQLGVYSAQHLNRYPTIQANSLPQLTGATNAAGELGEPGPKYPLGPYLLEAPMNPFDGSRSVTAVTARGQKPTGVVGKLGGWQFDESNGALWPNNPEAYKQQSASDGTTLRAAPVSP
jgi:general secretion pathway protein G